MLFMVVEHIRPDAVKAVGERFKTKGRMLPEGVLYHVSWMETSGERCFQIMEAADVNALNVWVSRWSDLVDFEIAPVLTSADYWSRARGES